MHDASVQDACLDSHGGKREGNKERWVKESLVTVHS